LLLGPNGPQKPPRGYPASLRERHQRTRTPRSLRARSTRINRCGASRTLQGARSAPCGGHLNIALIMRPRSGEQRGVAALRIISRRYV
jgi:hypothetical protein